MPNSYQMILITIETTSGKPSIDAAARQLGVSVTDIDASYGVIALDVEGKRFAVRVRADKVDAACHGQDGSFSDPPIEPFGPPRGR